MSLPETIIVASDLADRIQSGEIGWQIYTFAYGWMDISHASLRDDARQPLWEFVPADPTKLSVCAAPMSGLTARRVGGAS
jgi:hypothetical protein